jgi:hypothetical protein
MHAHAHMRVNACFSLVQGAFADTCYVFKEQGNKAIDCPSKSSGRGEDYKTYSKQNSNKIQTRESL